MSAFHLQKELKVINDSQIASSLSCTKPFTVGSCEGSERVTPDENIEMFIYIL